MGKASRHGQWGMLQFGFELDLDMTFDLDYEFELYFELRFESSFKVLTGLQAILSLLPSKIRSDQDIF